MRHGPIMGHPWSADDVMMVIGWIVILPHAATRFEHEILVPPVASLTGGGAFLIAAAATLMELTFGALLARALGTTARKMLPSIVCLWRTRRIGPLRLQSCED
ncbi:MAG TPA: hypothetical protein VMB34_07695 [Acetobacteraceae bacterium]|nr:hypothetical protein [Acetobacteraceae bacterium]